MGMAVAFHDIVEKIQALDLDSKMEIQNLLGHWISEERRAEILKNAELSRKEYHSSKTKSFTNAADMIHSLNEA